MTRDLTMSSRSSVDVLKDHDTSNQIMKRGRGRPKGVCNSIIMVPKLQIRSSIKLRSNKSSHPSVFSASSRSDKAVSDTSTISYIEG
jgi:hypothetical protein